MPPRLVRQPFVGQRTVQIAEMDKKPVGLGAMRVTHALRQLRSG